MIDAIIEFMTTFHKGGRYGGAYGWVYVLAVFVSIGSALGARELLERRKRLLTRTGAGIATGQLIAAAVIEQNGSSRTLEGVVQSVGGTYELTLRESSGSTHSESKHTFSSIEQLEQYLESSTALRLGDFKSG